MTDALRTLLLAPLREALCSDGWRLRGHQLQRTATNCPGAIKLLKSDIGHGMPFVTAELAVSYVAIRDFLGGDGLLPPDLATWHWERRIGNLLGEGNDTWWELAASPTKDWSKVDPIASGAAISTLLDAIVDVGVPAVLEHMDSSTVRHMWNAGNDWNLGPHVSRLYGAILAWESGDRAAIPGILDGIPPDIARSDAMATHIRRFRLETRPS